MDPLGNLGKPPLETRDQIYEDVAALSHNTFCAEEGVPAFALGRSSIAIKAELLETMNQLRIVRNTCVFESAIYLHNTRLRFVGGWRYPSTRAKNIVLRLEIILPKKISRVKEGVPFPFAEVVQYCWKWAAAERVVVEIGRPDRNGFPGFEYDMRS